MFLRGIFGAAFGCPFPAFQSLFPSRGKAVTDEGENVEEPRASSSASLRSAPSPLWGGKAWRSVTLFLRAGSRLHILYPGRGKPRPYEIALDAAERMGGCKGRVFANISGESARRAAAPYMNHPASVGARLCVRPETGGSEPHPVGRGLAPAATLCLVPVPRPGQAPALRDRVGRGREDGRLQGPPLQSLQTSRENQRAGPPRPT